jgi:hypothetical protein
MVEERNDVGEGDLGFLEQERPSSFYPYNQETILLIPVCPRVGELWPLPLWATVAGREESH